MIFLFVKKLGDFCVKGCGRTCKNVSKNLPKKEFLTKGKEYAILNTAEMPMGTVCGGGTFSISRKSKSFFCLPRNEGGDAYVHDLGIIFPVLHGDPCDHWPCRQYLQQ